MKPLSPEEEVLEGNWMCNREGLTVRDAAEERIIWLKREWLKLLATENWCRLYRDPEDGRLWELDYPHGGWQGGGPSRLTQVTAAYAAEHYPSMAHEL